MTGPASIGWGSRVTYPFYKVLHLAAVILLFTSLGGLIALAIAGVTTDAQKRARFVLASLHGVALFALLVAGFGLAARLQMMREPWPAWLFAKLGIWVVVAASVAVIKRTPRLGTLWTFVVPALGLTAAYLGVYKPY